MRDERIRWETLNSWGLQSKKSWILICLTSNLLSNTSRTRNKTKRRIFSTKLLACRCVLHVTWQWNIKKCRLLCCVSATHFTCWINYAVINSTSCYLLKTSSEHVLEDLLYYSSANQCHIFGQKQHHVQQSSPHMSSIQHFSDNIWPKFPQKWSNRLPLFNPCNPQKYSRTINVCKHRSGHPILTMSHRLHLVSGLRMQEIVCRGSINLSQLETSMTCWRPKSVQICRSKCLGCMVSLWLEVRLYQRWDRGFMSHNLL